jgi:signal transduction histidine kinase
LADSQDETRPEELQMFLEGIQSGSRRLNSLVESLLMLVHLDTNVYVQEYQRFSVVEKNISRFVEVVTTNLNSQAARKNLQLKVETRGQIDPVRIVPDHVMVVLNNLLDNAIKFTNKPGETIRISIFESNNRVFVEIIDPGIGIDPKDIPNLFNRFRQIDRSKHEQAGIGVGLTIARGLAKIQGGDIQVKSELDVGSTFSLWFPVYKETDEIIS